MHSIKKLLAEDKMVRVFSMGSFPSPKLVEVLGRVGSIHGLWFDQEHCDIPHAQLELMMMACRACGLDAFARVPPTDYATIMRPMEAGCSGVMVAQIRTLDEVHEVVQWAKYPPRGTRGLFMANVECGYGTGLAAKHVIEANEDRWLAIQIETAEAVTLVDQIAEVAGVDMLFVGPGDLACTLGVPGEPLHPKCVAALERVSLACRNAGIPWGALSRDAAHANKCRELGCRLFSLASDMDVIHRGIRSTEQLYGDFFA